MSSKKDKYRNPPTPLGYIKKKPDIVLKEKNDVNDIVIERLINLVIESGNWDEPDLSIYEHFTINSDSDSEEVIEIPFVPCPKKVEVVDIEDDDVTPESLKDVLIQIKKEDAPKDHAATETSENLEQESKVLASSELVKIPQKTDSHSFKSEKISPVKKTKKHDQGYKRSSHSKKIKERRDRHNSYDSDSNTGKRSKHKGKKDSKRDGSDSKSRHKRKRNYDGVSDSHSKSQYKRRESYDSSGNDSRTSQDKRREGYDSESNSHTSRHKRRESYDSDDDLHKRRRDTRDNSSSGRRVYERSDSERGNDSKSNFKIANLKHDYLSDNSEYSSVRNVRMCSPSPCSSKEYERTVRSIKQEEPDLLFGEYPCKVCHVMMNSSPTYQAHLQGKKHKKNLDAQRAAEERVSNKVVCVSEDASKCPKPPPGYNRVKQEDCIAKIQPLLEEQLLVPSPGLDKVIEIHGPSETTYHCTLCNCNCSGNSILPHLNGHKHQLFCLKHFRLDLYDIWSHKPKYAIEKKLRDILRTLEKEFGRGLVTVEKDFTESDKTAEFPSSSTRDLSKRSTSASGSYSECYFYNSMPDPTKSGFLCNLCNSHCNSLAMWQSHIEGNRHQANVKKAPGTAPSKCKYIPAGDNVRPHIFSLLDRQNPDHEPVVGLDQIREILKPDIDAVMYNCFLCGCCLSSLEIVDHILSPKHRAKYLDNIKHPDMETLKLCQVSESYRGSIIYEICERVEKERGCGKPEVYYAKNAVIRG